jgi:SAM-dependent methyltransferase
MRSLRNWVKQRRGVKRAALAAMRFSAPLFTWLNLRALPAYVRFFSDLRRFRAAGGKASLLDAWPCLLDRTAVSGIDTHYFHQAVWAMRHIREQAAAEHVDIGSDVNFVGMLTTITSVTFIDIRPLQLTIPNFTGKAGSITALPLADNSVASLSSLHVIEHIGLGRYGDPIDPTGPERAASEIKRVLRPGGRAYVSTPIGRARVQFNGQRVFAAQEIPSLFAGLSVSSFSMVDARGVFHERAHLDQMNITEEGAGMDCGLGMYVLEKRVAA